MPVRVVHSSQSADLLNVLCDAFFDYPVMRYVLGDQPDYSRRLHTLIGLFMEARIARDDLMLGILDDDGSLVAGALVNLPGERAPGPGFDEFRERTWDELGHAERRRYDAFGAASHAFDPTTPHHHLGMIGVRVSHHGKGLGRHLLDHVHALADADPGSAGVSLTTELPRNLSLYEHFGYSLAGHSRVAPDLETWSFFRPAMEADRR